LPKGDPGIFNKRNALFWTPLRFYDKITDNIINFERK